MNDRLIFLAKLSQGQIGEENAHLLGTLLVSRFHQLALSRQEQKAKDRREFFLFIDEFHNFVTPSMAALLSGARKYRLGLVLAHQDLRQLSSRDADVASSVLANAYTRVVFRVGEHDARVLADGFAFFEPADLLNLGVGQAIARIERAEFDFNLACDRLPELDADETSWRRTEVIEQSREAYGTLRSDVEAQLRSAFELPGSGPEPSLSDEDQIPGTPAKTTPSIQRRQRKAPSVLGPEPQPKEAREKGQSGPPEPANVPPLPGRGGPQHKYLQALVKRLAEDRGFRVTLERRVLDGAGHVDIALEHGDLLLGCEISVTTDARHEVANLQKCVAAGFDLAVLVSSDKATLREAERAIKVALSSREIEKVRFATPESLIGILDELQAKRAAASSTVRGYKVNVSFGTVSESERQAREALLADVISKSLRRLKK